MAIHVKTNNAADLLLHLRRLIDAGKIKTWSYDKDLDFTHTAPQWASRAWLRPTERTDELVLNILAPKGVGMTKAVYAIYHGRFIEVILTHADHMCTAIRASALAEIGDHIGTRRQS